MKKLLYALIFLCSTVWAQQPTTSWGPKVINNAQCLTVDTRTGGTALITVSGTWSGTLQFAGSMAGQPAVNISVAPYGSTTSQSTITANGTYWATIATFDAVSVCGATVGSGSATVYINIAPQTTRNGTGGAIPGGGGTVNTGTKGLPAAYPSSTAAVVATGLYIDAAQFTSGIAGDSCAAITNSIASTAFTNGTLTIDTRAFQGNQACNSDPYGSYNGVIHLILADNVNWITSVPWLTPSISNSIYAGVTGNSAATTGARIQASGPLVSAIPGVAYTSNQASFNATIPNVGSTAVTVNQLTLSAAPLTFQIPHGPAPAGSFWCVICQGGQNWNADADAQHIEHVAISTGGNSNIAAVYSTSTQERSELIDSRLGCCGTGTNAFGYLGDRTEFSTGTVTSGGSARAGVTRPVIRDVNMAGEQTAACTSCYMIAFEGSAITVVFTGGTCSTMPTAFVPASDVSAGVITAVLVGNPGACTVGPTSATIYGAPTTFGNSLNTTATVSSVTLAGSSPNITVTAVNLSSGGSGYVNAAITGGPMISDIACAGLAGGNTIWDCILLDGVGVSWLQNIHNINGGNYVVEEGLYGYVSGGEVINVDSSTAGGVHLSYGIDGGQSLFSIGAGNGKNVILDDVYLPGAPLTVTNFGRGVASYFPGSYLDALTGFYVPCNSITQTEFTGLAGLSCNGNAFTLGINGNSAWTMTPQGTATKGINWSLAGTAPEITLSTANSFMNANALFNMPNNRCTFNFTVSTLTTALSPVSMCTGSNGGNAWGGLPSTAGVVWNWQCSMQYSVQAGTSPTFAIGVTWAHAPTAAAQQELITTTAANAGINANTTTTTNVTIGPTGILGPPTGIFWAQASGTFTGNTTGGTWSPTLILTGSGSTGTAVGGCTIF